MNRLLALAGLLAPAASAAATVSGTVFVDRDGNGLFGAGDEPVVGVVVGWETTVFAVTDAAGRYTLDAPRAGIVWVRTPEGYSPEPSWSAVAGGETAADLPLRPAVATGPVMFVAAADSHLGIASEGEAALAFAQAVDTYPAPHFITILGDLSNVTSPVELASVKAARGQSPVPLVPVPGNHDWHDGGPAYREAFGPPSYSFDSGGVHFIVLNFNAPQAERLAFVTKDLSFPHGGSLVAVFQHAPPPDAMVEALAASGVDYLFTGHTHSNRVIEQGGVLQYNTETLVMGGLDFTPAGYRVMSLVGGELRAEHHTTVVERVLSLTHPGSECVPAGTVRVVAAAEVGASTPSVTVAVDGGSPSALTPSGGWTHSGTVTLAEGSHTLELVARWAQASTLRRSFTACVRPAAPPPAVTGEWTQLQGSADHHGVVATRIETPLRQVWARAVGGYVFGGSPVLSGGLLYVPVVDLAEGKGGVVALDARTGETRWEARPGGSVRNAPAVAGGMVVFATDDGIVFGVRADTGEQAWSQDLAAGVDDYYSWVYAAPVADGDIVYIGSQVQLSAINARTGVEEWSMPGGDRRLGVVTMSSAAVGGGVGVGVLGRGLDGIRGWDAADGVEMWRIAAPVSTALNAAPIIDGSRVYITGYVGHVCAADLVTGLVTWDTNLYDRAGDLVFLIVGTPALAGGRLFVATPRNLFAAVDAATGEIAWTVDTGPGVIRPLPYGWTTAETQAFLASPVVTGDQVWVAGVDGRLRALKVDSGDEEYALDLRAPLLSGPVPSPPYLFIGSFDGTVRALASESAFPPPAEGCGVGGRGGGGAALWIVALMLLVRRRRAP